MKRIRTSGRRRLATAALAFAAVCTAAPYGVANATPTFDVDGYSDCTATAVPGPDGNVDGIATDCCIQQAGIPTDTRFGVGCVAPMDNPAPDYRPTIILPTRPVPPEENQEALDELIELPIPQPFDEPLPLP